MRTMIHYKKLILIAFIILSTDMACQVKNPKQFDIQNLNELLYDNVWGTIYHAESKQCDDSPNITGDGSKIDTNNASKHRWIAISQEMLKCSYRAKLANNTNSVRYKGKIQYGDTVWIVSKHKEINGWWVVKDAKNASLRKSIDFLQTKGDGKLYNNNKSWSGKFLNIKIYRKKVINEGTI